MGKYIKSYLYIFIFCILFNLSSYAQDDLLTIKQKLDRLQREVNDISKSVFTNSNINSSIEDNTKNQTVNFAAIDMRIYDIEKDIKNLTMNLEELIFKFDEIEKKINNLETNFNDQLSNFNTQKNQENINNTKELEEETEDLEENTLGTLKISSNDVSALSTDLKEADIGENDESNTIAPEEQFQIAFDKIRKKQYGEAKLLLTDFISNNPNNQLSGSAHYWLGELLLLEKNQFLIQKNNFYGYFKSCIMGKGPFWI